MYRNGAKKMVVQCWNIKIKGGVFDSSISSQKQKKVLMMSNLKIMNIYHCCSDVDAFVIPVSTAGAFTEGIKLSV